MTQEIGNRRLAAQDLLQNYLGSWEFPPNDLSGLGIKPEDANVPAGGNLAYQGPRMGGEAPVQDLETLMLGNWTTLAGVVWSQTDMSSRVVLGKPQTWVGLLNSYVPQVTLGMVGTTLR